MLFLRVFGLTLGLFSLVQPAPLNHETVVQAELILGAKDLSRPFSVGLRFALAPEWYLYWMNPGDAGLPAEIRWFLPPGLEAGPCLFPVPEKFVSGGIVAFGYKKEVVLLTEIRPRPGFQWDEKTAIAAEVDWLVCKESCLRGLSRVEIFPAGMDKNRLHRGQKLISSYRRRLPLSVNRLGLSWGDATIHREGHKITIETPFALKKSYQPIDFFPYPLAEGTFEHAGIRIEGNKLILPIVLYESGVAPSSIKGLLIVSTRRKQRQGYEVRVPLQ